jgi:hypothetical protein
LERIEDRVLLTVQAISLADPNLLAAGGEGSLSQSGRTVSDDGRFVVYDAYDDNAVPGDNNHAGDVIVRDLSSGAATLVSVTPQGTPGNSDSGPGTITPNGRFVVFTSAASNLVSGDTNGKLDVFVRDLAAGTTTLVSVNSSGTGSADNDSFDPVITPDGRYVAFESYSRTLVSGDTSFGRQVYRRDLLTGTTVLASTGQGSSSFPYISTLPMISDDGRYVGFQSAQSYNFATKDIYVHDVVAGTTALVSVNTAGTGGGDHDSTNAVMTPDGRYVAFVSSATNLVAGDTNNATDVFVRDLVLRKTYVASASTTGVPGNGSSGVDGWGNTQNPGISADGRYVAFTSWATNLAGGSPTTLNIYVRDLAALTTRQVSVSTTGGQPNNYSDHPFISANGQYVGFLSYASNLVNLADAGGQDIFVRNLSAGTTALVTVNSAGTAATNGVIYSPSITPDGRYVAFESGANNLVAHDDDGEDDVFVRDLTGQTTTLVSPHDPNLPSLTPNSNSYTQPAYTHAAAASADGRYVTFTTSASNVVPNDNNNDLDVFVGDRLTGMVTLVSANQAGTGSGNRFSQRPAISADGRYVAFDSLASDLVTTPDNNANSDVFVRDVQTGTTTLVSVNRTGTASSNGGGTSAVISPDGRYVAFQSRSTDLTNNPDLNGTFDVYLRDLQTGTTTLISVNPSGAAGNGSSANPVFTPDGRYVVFQSTASDLVPNDTNGTTDVFMRDLVTGTTTLVSVNSAGTGSGNGASQNAFVTPDGRYVAFESSASNLVPNDTNGATDVFVRDLVTGTTTLVSVNSAGTGSGNGASQHVGISADGRYVTFDSSASNLVGGDTNGASDVFVRDLVAGTTTLVSINAAGTGAGNGDSTYPVISPDGRGVVFGSTASDLAAGDTNGSYANVFLRDLVSGTTALVDAHAGRYSYVLGQDYTITADGQHVVFDGTGDDLTPGDYNIQPDVFVWSHGPPVARPGGPYTVAEGGSVVLHGSASTDVNDAITLYEWDFNYDGSTFNVAATGATPTFAAGTLDGPSTRTVALRVTDQFGVQSVGTTTLTITNTPPSAVLGNNGPVNETSAATVSFTNASDPSAADTAAGFHYSFALAATNLAGNYAAAGTATSAQFTFDDNGSYTVYGRVFDKDDGFTDYTTTVTVNDVPPTATLSNNGPVNEGSSATVSFSGAQDPSTADTQAGFHYSFALTAANLATSYAAAGSSSSAPFTFDDNGSYTVFGRVFDKDNGFTDYQTTVVVNNVAPTATLANNGPVGEGSPATISFTGSSDPSQADTAAGFHYSFALVAANLAGSYSSAVPTASAPFTFDDNGSYTVYGRIYDKDNGFTDYQTTVVVNNVAPTATFSNNGPVNEASPATVSFASPSDPSQADTAAGFRYSFALAAANLAGSYAAAGTAASAQYTFDDNGSYTVYGRVFDKDDGFTDYTTTVTVNDVPPTATLSNNGPVNEASPVTVAFSNPSDPSTADTVAGFRYSFALAPANLAGSYAAAGTAASAPFTFDDNGSYTVYGRVFDKDNGFTDYQTTVVVNNVAPTASLANNGPVNEGSPATVSFANPSDPSAADTAAGFRYSFALAAANLAGTYAAAGTAASAPFTFGDNGSYTVYGRVFDKDGGYTDYTTTVTVRNVAPTAALGNNGPVNEASPATVSFSGAQDPSSADTAAGFRYSFALTPANLAGSYAAAGTASSASFTFNDNGSYTVYGRIFDKDNGFSDYTTTVTVKNVAPAAGVSGPATGARGQARTFTLTAIDPSPVDQAAAFTYLVDWGDGSAQQTVSGAPASTQAAHVFVASGTYTVKVWATDKDGGQSPSPASTTITVKAVDLQGTTLVVGGTLAGDTIVIKPADTSGSLSVTINGTGAGVFPPPSQILVYAQAGDDTVQLQSNKIRSTVYHVVTPAVLFGGDGNDTLDASGSLATNVLLGEAGNDTLQGGPGRSLLVGGLGSDTLHGGGADDILIGGTTDYDNNLTALTALMAEWGRTDLAYQDRINHLTGSVAGGLNGAYFLSATTVHDDAAVDQLYGGAGQDWFLYRATGGQADVLHDKQSNEVATPI